MTHIGMKTAQEAQGRQGKADDASQAILGPGALRVFPGGDQVDGLPPAPSNAHSGTAGHAWSKTICGKGVLQSQRARDPTIISQQGAGMTLVRCQVRSCVKGMSNETPSTEPSP